MNSRVAKLLKLYVTAHMVRNNIDDKEQAKLIRNIKRAWDKIPAPDRYGTKMEMVEEINKAADSNEKYAWMKKKALRYGEKKKQTETQA